MFFAFKKSRSKIIYFFIVLLVCDTAFVHKVHPMALSAVQAASWCAQLCMAGCAALMQRNNSAHCDVIAQCTQACTVAQPEQKQIQESNVVQDTLRHDVAMIPDLYRSYVPDKRDVKRLSASIQSDWDNAVEHYAGALHSSLQKVRAQQQERWTAQYKNPTRVYSDKNYTIAIDTPVGTGYAIVRSKTPRIVETFYQEKRDFVHRISTDQNVWNTISTTFDSFVTNSKLLIAGDIFDQVLAVFSIGDFAIDDNFMGAKLIHAQKELWHTFFHKDGSLCVDSLCKRYEAWEIVKNYTRDIFNCSGSARYKDFFNQIKPSKNNTKRCDDLFKKPLYIPDNFAQKIANNRFNQDIKKMVGALAHGDTEIAQSIKQKCNGVKMLFNVCNKRYTEIVQAYQRSLQDIYGIYRFNDLLYIQLSAPEKQLLKNNKNNRDEFNQLLITRDRFKQLLQQAWNISSTVPIVVHEALYKLLGDDTQSENVLGNVPLCIDRCIEFVSGITFSGTAWNALNNAFFLRNGIHKDLAKYERAQSLKLPAKILDHEFLQVRRVLNHCVYHEHVSKNDNVKVLALKGVECIEKAFALSSDKQIHIFLERNFSVLHNQVQELPDTQLTYIFGDVKRNYCDALPETKDPQQDDEERTKTEEWGCGTGRITEIKAAKDVCSSGFIHDSDSFDKLSEASCQPNINQDSEKEPAVCSSGIQEAEPVTTCNDSTQTISGFEADKDSDAVIKEVSKYNFCVEVDEYKIQVIKAAKEAVSKQITDKKSFFKKLLQDYIKEHQSFSENTKQKTVCKPHGIETFGRNNDKKHKIISKEFDAIDIAVEELEKLLKALEEIVDLAPVECGEKTEKIWIDYEHILAPLIKINCETGQYYVAGFHHDWQGKIQASGIIKSEVIKQFENGVYEIEWSYANAKAKKSGMFPDVWPLDKVIRKILEAIRNPIKEPTKEGRRCIIHGITNEGIKIEVVFEAKKDDNPTGKIITAYPDTENNL